MWRAVSSVYPSIFLALSLQEDSAYVANMNLKRSLNSIVLAFILSVCFCAATATPSIPTVTANSAGGATPLRVGANQDLFCSITPPTHIPFCSSTGNTVTATVSGGTLPYKFFWTIIGDGRLTGSQDAQTITFDMGSGGVNLVLTATDAIGATVQCSLVSTCAPAPEFSTLGQGAYGNPGGSFNGGSTLALTQGLLSSGDVIVGKPGRSVRIQVPSAWCISQRLPAAGTPRELPSTLGDAVLNSATCQTASTSLPLTSAGKFHNVMLGQTIALSLNTRLSAGLASTAICNMMTTQAALPGADGLLGTNDDVRNPGQDGTLGTADDPIITVNIPPSVTTALLVLGLPRTVSGLLELANRGVAGESTGGASLGDVNAAVNAINVAFDKCRFLLSCADF